MLPWFLATALGRVLCLVDGGSGDGSGDGAGDSGGAAGGVSGGDGGSGDGGSDQGDPADPDAALLKDPAGVLALIKKLRPFETEARSLRATNANLAAKVRTFEDAQLTEQQRADKARADLEVENSRLKAELQEGKVRSAFAAAAATAGALYPDDVWKLVDLARVEFDGEGKPTNLDGLLGEIRTARPGYFRATGSNGSADGGVKGRAAGSKPDMDALLRGLR